MENFFTRYRNVVVLTAVLMAQIILLAMQVKRTGESTYRGDSMSLLRFWVVESIVPAEKAITSIGGGFGSLWRNYIALRGARQQNEELRAQLDRVRLEEVALAQDAGQARRLQALLAFKERIVSQTVAAQVIGSSGSEQSRVLYIDKGSNDGLKQDMAVITPRGIVGKISRVFSNTAQVLELNDATAGAGVMLERSRLRGVMHGTASGIPEILHVMADEKIEAGEPIVSSGGDQIFPRGLPVGTVLSIAPDPEGGPFMVVRVRPAANLDQVEEVLVIVKTVEKEPETQQSGTSVRAADILAQRLPTVVPKALTKGADEPLPTSALYAKKPAIAKTGASVLPGTTELQRAGSKPVGQATKKVVNPVNPDSTATAGTTDGILGEPSTTQAKPPANPKKPDSDGAADKGLNQTPQETPQ
jgi:rod shape-determining protein MreC